MGNSFQGQSVSLSADGNTAIVGATGDHSYAGAAWIWTRSAGVWTQQGPKLTGSDTVGTNLWQGNSVSLADLGNMAIIGAPHDNGTHGAALIWTRNAGVWTQHGSKMVGSGAVGIAAQGQSVSLSADGNTAIVGGYSDTAQIGAAWVWNRIAGVWTPQSTKLVGSGAAGNTCQGYSEALSADGNTAIVGGYGDNSNGGAAWIFTAVRPRRRAVK